MCLRAGIARPYMPVGADSISARELRHNPIFTYYTVFSPIIQSQKGEIPMQITRLSAAECEDLYRSALPRDFPAAELKPFAEIQRLLESGVYEPLLLIFQDGR